MSLENRGRKPGQPKVGGAVKGSIKTHTNAVKEAVLRVFEEVNKDDTYLRALAVEDQRLFLSLLARLIPTAVDIEQKVTLDLGAEMAAANERLAIMNAAEAANTPTPVIDITPEPVRAKPQPELTDPRLLPTKPSKTPAEPDPSWPGYE